MADITYIPIRQLHPHPDNPRKELGDLSELAASIKENGVYQNLTVIPGHYLSSREYISKCVDEGGDAYEDYCRSHPDYKNNRCICAVANIKRVYNERLQKHDFS